MFNTNITQQNLCLEIKVFTYYHSNLYRSWMFEKIDGEDNYVTSSHICDLLFGKETDYEVIDTFIQLVLLRQRRHNPSLFHDFECLSVSVKGYALQWTEEGMQDEYMQMGLQNLPRPPTQVHLLFSPMHVGTNHWALMVINIKEKGFQVYDSMKQWQREDIPQYVNLHS